MRYIWIIIFIIFEIIEWTKAISSYRRTKDSWDIDNLIILHVIGAVIFIFFISLFYFIATI